MAKSISLFFLGLLLGAFIGGLIVFVVLLALGKTTLGEDLQVSISTTTGAVGTSTLPTPRTTLSTLLSTIRTTEPKNTTAEVPSSSTLSTWATKEPTITASVANSTTAEPAIFSTVPSSMSTEAEYTTTEVSSTSTLLTSPTKEPTTTTTVATTTAAEPTTSNTALISTPVESTIITTMQTSTTTELGSTTMVQTTMTAVPTTTTTEPLATSSSVLSSAAAPRANLTCFIVGDMYNFGSDQTAYDQERSFIGNITQSIFSLTTFKAGLGLYGYADTSLWTGLIKMTTQFDKFVAYHLNKMVYDDSATEMTTEDTIKEINKYRKFNEKGANCLVFFSALLDTSGLPELKPNMSADATIIAIGFNGTQLQRIVGGRGQAISVPYAFKQEDVQKVVGAVIYE